MINTKKLCSAVLAAGVLAMGVPSGGALADGIKIGILSCEAIEGTRVNLLIRSTVDVACTFDSGSYKEAYRGETGIEFGSI